MKPTRIIGILAAAGMALGMASAAMADSGPIDAREACMKANGKMVKSMVRVLKGQAAYNKAAIDAAIGKTEQACAGWADWWGEDTKASSGADTEAKDEIWSDKAGFEAATAAYLKARDGAKASTDEASLKAAFPALGGACKGCHEKYRKADD